MGLKLNKGTRIVVTIPDWLARVIIPGPWRIAVLVLSFFLWTMVTYSCSVTKTEHEGTLVTKFVEGQSNDIYKGIVLKGTEKIVMQMSTVEYHTTDVGSVVHWTTEEDDHPILLFFNAIAIALCVLVVFCLTGALFDGDFDVF